MLYYFKEKGGDKVNNKPYFEVQTVTLKGNKRVEHSENLERIKLPFYCYYSYNDGKSKNLGIVDYINSTIGYVLLTHSGHYDYSDRGAVGGRKKLDDLIKAYNINTVKVKVIVY